MNPKQRWFPFLLIGGGLILAYILVLLASQAPATAYARPGWQAQPTPRNIFVDSEDAKGCTKNQAEHIRFGTESSHYFTFLGKGGQWYKAETDIFSTDAASVSIDTKVLIYRHNPLENPNEQPIAQNDDRQSNDIGENQGDDPLDASDLSTVDVYESEVIFGVTEDRYYWIEVQNLVQDGAGSYCLQVENIERPADQTAPDHCEFNNTLASACEVEIVAQTAPNQAVTKNNTRVPYEFPPTAEPGNSEHPGSFIYNFIPTADQGPDLDYYKIWVKKDQTYICQTYELALGNDTRLTLYDHNGHDFGPAGHNDDIAPGNKASKVAMTVDYTGWLYVLVEPYVEVDVNYGERYFYKMVCVNELYPNPDQMQDNRAVPTDPDTCEVNNTFDLASACQVLLEPTPKGADVTPKKIEGTRGDENKPLNFAPWSQGIRDVDYFKLWMKAGWTYTCTTIDLESGNDTKMTIYYADGTVVGVNDDYQPDVDLGSRVTIGPDLTRTGWLLIKVEPVMSFILSDGGDYQYKLHCRAEPYPGASLENLNAPGTLPEATRHPDDTWSATPESGESLAAAAVPTTTPLPITALNRVSFVPLPTAVPTPPAARQTETAVFTVQIYYDANDNRRKDEGEGVGNIPVYIANGLAPTPLAFHTTEAGAVFVETETAVGDLQLIIPFLNINQAIPATTAQDIRLRIAPTR